MMPPSAAHHHLMTPPSAGPSPLDDTTLSWINRPQQRVENVLFEAVGIFISYSFIFITDTCHLRHLNPTTSDSDKRPKRHVQNASFGPSVYFIHLSIFILTTATSATQILPPQMDKWAQTMRHLGLGIFFIYLSIFTTNYCHLSHPNPATSDG